MEQKDAPERTDVYTLLRYTLDLYIASAWQLMGFLPDPATGKTHMALDEAQIAIDCADFIAGKLKPHLEPEVQREYERQLRDLKLNFVVRLDESRKEA
ncbi:MAG: DUF1844 domain-containing protein [Fimbriimonadales bacterium]|nr:DUF1844 domain-containing protein [Fimbriimonadales bacterium]MDW8051083.1 DUF1844 domain-containing protein [Armatimonadota bacterium]